MMCCYNRWYKKGWYKNGWYKKGCVVIIDDMLL